MMLKPSLGIAVAMRSYRLFFRQQTLGQPRDRGHLIREQFLLLFQGCLRKKKVCQAGCLTTRPRLRRRLYLGMGVAGACNGKPGSHAASVWLVLSFVLSGGS